MPVASAIFLVSAATNPRCTKGSTIGSSGFAGEAGTCGDGSTTDAADGAAPRRGASQLRATPPIAKPAPAKAAKKSNGLPPDARELQLGDAAPDFRLLGIDGRQHSLADYRGAKLLMVVFLSNHCPYSHAAETRLIPLAKEFRPQGLEVVAINPNSPDSVRVDELGYSKYNDSYEEMKLYARDAGFPFPYLYEIGRAHV